VLEGPKDCWLVLKDFLILTIHRDDGHVHDYAHAHDYAHDDYATNDHGYDDHESNFYVQHFL
jgi:hypothetical protein